MIPTKNEYYGEIALLWQEINALKRILMPEYATVTGFSDNKELLLKFEGETVASKKTYAMMRHYDDARVGDRVRVSGNIIDGTFTR